MVIEWLFECLMSEHIYNSMNSTIHVRQVVLRGNVVNWVGLTIRLWIVENYHEWIFQFRTRIEGTMLAYDSMDERVSIEGLGCFQVGVCHECNVITLLFMILGYGFSKNWWFLSLIYLLFTCPASCFSIYFHATTIPTNCSIIFANSNGLSLKLVP